MYGWGLAYATYIHPKVSKIPAQQTISDVAKWLVQFPKSSHISS